MTYHCLAADIDPALKTKLDDRMKEVVAIAADPRLVAAVKAHNAEPANSDMTQEKWAATSALESTVRNLTKTIAAEVLKEKRSDAVTEAFVSGADGTKVGFLSKPTNWSHKGKAKHDVPMSGKTWQGPIEKDESTGFEQVQLAAPILDGGKPIGSLVVGYSINRL